MEVLFWILVSIGAFLCISYFILIGSYCYGWNRLNDSNLVLNTSVAVSIIIAARNEETNLKKCLDAILAQNYPKEKLEILVVDDHSTDATIEIISAYATKNAIIKCLKLPDNTIGKKQAIASAIDISCGELIVTTDADCVMGANLFLKKCKVWNLWHSLPVEVLLCISKKQLCAMEQIWHLQKTCSRM